MASSRPEPTWQCVMICWGDRYGAEVINHLASKIAQSAGSHPRFVLMTDRSRNGLLPEIKTVGFPAFYLQDAFKGGGCQAKLGMFEKGVLPEDLPAVYVDLDTAILGDLTKAFDFQPVEETIQMLQSAILPFGGLARLIYRITSKRKYARGNSSIVVFHPARCHFMPRSSRPCMKNMAVWAFGRWWPTSGSSVGWRSPECGPFRSLSR